jgi:hypothetical protein
MYYVRLPSKNTSQHANKARAEFVQLLDLRLLRLASFPPELLRRCCTLLSFSFYRVRDVFVVFFVNIRVRGVVVEFKILQIELCRSQYLFALNVFGPSYLIQSKVT